MMANSHLFFEEVWYMAFPFSMAVSMLGHACLICELLLILLIGVNRRVFLMVESIGRLGRGLFLVATSQDKGGCNNADKQDFIHLNFLAFSS